MPIDTKTSLNGEVGSKIESKFCVRQCCEEAKTRLEKCADFERKRQFALDYIERVTFGNGRVTLRGSVPVKIKAYEDLDQPSEASKIGYIITTTG